MNDPSPQWHSIRPWRPTLSLCVREITSVSATFILSSPLASSGDVATNDGTEDESVDTDDDIMESDVVLEGEEGRRNGNSGGSGGQQQQRRQTQIVADALSKGLSVKVNGTPWQRVLMKVDEEADEAVIILFGLMPGRQYDVELGIVHGENSLRSQITTELSVSHPVTDNDAGAIEFSVSGEQQQQQHLLSSTPPTSASHSLANGSAPPTASTSTPVSTSAAPPFSLEDRRLQLSHTLSQLTNEHATLTATLKTARREAQKADAALRSEIDILKRASEKSAGQEHRARQKVLALQEAVRRSVAATEEVKVMIAEVEGMLPGLEMRRKEVEGEWERVKAEAKAVKEQREVVEREERMRLEAMQNEMAGLGNRMEKLNVKREKLEGDGGVLSELEERLKKLEEERTRIENDPFGFNGDSVLNESEDQLTRRRGSVDSRTGDSPPSDNQQHPHSHPPGLPHHPHATHHPHSNLHIPHHNPHPRKRHSHPANSRSAPQQQHPIQRPSHSSRLSLPAGPGVIHLNKSQGLHGPGSNFANPAATNSTLSSRAPPFEPGRRPPLLPTNSSGSGSVRSDLNPGSSPFAPRSGIAIAAMAASHGASAVVGGKRTQRRSEG